jgi:hypothetical protein
MISRSKWVITVASTFCLVATPALAQTPPAGAAKVSHWGIEFSATPSWYLPKQITDSLAGDGGTLVVVGSQFSIGLVHGRAMGGDWGVTFVHQPVKNGSRGSDTDTDCGYTNGPLPGGCFNTGGGAVTQGVSMNGVQVHKFIPFVTIKRRFQIGLNVAGGFGTLSGTLQKTSSDVTNVTVNQKTGARAGTLTTTVTTENVADEVFRKVPLGRITVVGALIVTQALKVRWEGGLLLPGASFSTVAVSYLFGAR